MVLQFRRKESLRREMADWQTVALRTGSLVASAFLSGVFFGSGSKAYSLLEKHLRSAAQIFKLPKLM